MSATSPERSAAPEGILFREKGATWWWVAAGPLAGVAMLFIQMWNGYGIRFLVPIAFVLLVGGFLSIQVKAGRIHTSVELTAEHLRQGAQTILVREIVKVYPEPAGSETPKWQSARALGELTGVPRGRTGIGLKLSGGRTAQAWAKRHRALRSTLVSLVDETTS